MLVTFAVLFSTIVAAPLRAQTEDQIKAAFLLNFARYVEWPEHAFPSAEAPVRICVLSSEGFTSVVSSTLADKTVGSRPVEVLDVEEGGDAASCHVLFVGNPAKRFNEQLLPALNDASVFTVGCEEDFARDGGIANFFRADNKIRFEINPEAARRVGLKVSSRLLRLARLVE